MDKPVLFSTALCACLLLTSLASYAQSAPNLPDESLFTNVPSKTEQVREHSFSFFGNNHKETTEASPTTTDQPNSVASTATTPAVATPTEPERLPDPSLFTQVPSKREQVRDHSLNFKNLQSNRAANAVKNTANRPIPAPNQDLFTEVPKIDEQNQDRPFKIF